MWLRKHFFLTIILLIVLSVPAYFALLWHRTMIRPMRIQAGVQSVKIYPGHTVYDLAKTLSAKGLITHPRIFIFAARFSNHHKKLRFGEYALVPGMSARNLLDHAISGQGLVKHQMTFVEGWTFTTLLKKLAENPNLFHRLKDKKPAEIMAMLEHPKRHPEGLFLPDTYTFIWGNTDIELLTNAYQRMQSYLANQWAGRAANLPYKNAYQALIAASLIEKETAQPAERSIIASVIVNRLRQHMRLQMDPTVLYGLHKPYGTPITRQDLRSQTPYNTYRINGLPPTPIALPSPASIAAALHPADTDYLYYVATGNGGHVFSTTYRQHLAAVKKYRAWQKQQAEELGWRKEVD